MLWVPGRELVRESIAGIENAGGRLGLSFGESTELNRLSLGGSESSESTHACKGSRHWVKVISANTTDAHKCTGPVIARAAGNLPFPAESLPANWLLPQALCISWT